MQSLNVMFLLPFHVIPAFYKQLLNLPKVGSGPPPLVSEQRFFYRIITAMAVNEVSEIAELGILKE